MEVDISRIKSTDDAVHGLPLEVLGNFTIPTESNFSFSCSLTSPESFRKTCFVRSVFDWNKAVKSETPNLEIFFLREAKFWVLEWRVAVRCL